MTMNEYFIPWLLGVLFGICVGLILVNEYYTMKCRLCKRKGNEKVL